MTTSKQAASEQQLASNYDAVIIGGGPAGTTVGALLAEYGHSVAILERSEFPRFHVGESLIPETYWPLKRLGLIDALKASAFPKKYSVQFVTDTGKESAPFYFDEYNPHESSQTWQVWRDQFDQMLLDNALAKGAVFQDHAHVTDVLFDENQRSQGVRVKLKDGDETESREVGAKVVVDATGITGFLVNRLGLKVTDPRLKKGTVWTYFENARRDEGKDEGATIILQTEGKKSWFWFIPLPDNVTSIGCTGDMEYMFDGSSAEEIFQRELSRCPGMLRRLEQATRCRDYFTTRDYSYRSKQAAGDGWVLVGDAAGFIDPVYSSGAYLALKSGELVADAVHEALEKNDLSADALGCWYPDYAKGVDNFRNLVYAFYTPGFSFGSFLREHPQYQSNVVDILIGDVFKPDVGEIFNEMQEIVQPSMSS